MPESHERDHDMAHNLRYEVNCSILFTERPLLERPDAAKAAGFDAVEFWWPFETAVPADGEVDRFVRAIDDAGVQLVGLNFFAGDMPGGDRGLVSWPARAAEFRDNVPVVIDIGRRLGCRAFNALYGNRLDGVTPGEQDELATQNLVLAAQAARQIDGTLLIEPVSGAPRYPLLTAADAQSVIDRVAASGGSNLGLLADLYHLAVNGDDVDAVITRYSRGGPDGGGIAHVQIADAPGRGEPGTGDLPLQRQLADLEAGGYQGWVGLEYKPSGDNPSTVASFEWLLRTRRAAGDSATSAS